MAEKIGIFLKKGNTQDATVLFENGEDSKKPCWLLPAATATESEVLKIRIKESDENVFTLAIGRDYKGTLSFPNLLLAPERLNALRQVATIESIGSSTRIEGVKLTDSEVEKLLTGVKTYSFLSRDEQEVGGYAEAMEQIFSSYKQLHGIVLKFSTKDECHRGEYKKFPNNVEAFVPNGKSIGIIFKTTSPFETPKRMKELVEWTNSSLESGTIHPLLVNH